MKRRLLITQQTPPGGWPYKDPESGQSFNHYVFEELKAQVRRFLKANNRPISLTLNEQIEDQICQHVPAEWCEGMEGRRSVEPISFDQALQGTAVHLDWLIHGRPYVNQEEANERAKTCAHCHFNSGIAGCSNCSMGKIRELVTRIVGDRTTESDQMIQACKICGCSLKSKVWFPLDIIQRHTSTEQNQMFPEWCWCKKN